MTTSESKEYIQGYNNLKDKKKTVDKSDNRSWRFKKEKMSKEGEQKKKNTETRSSNTNKIGH